MIFRPPYVVRKNNELPTFQKINYRYETIKEVIARLEPIYKSKGKQFAIRHSEVDMNYIVYEIDDNHNLFQRIEKAIPIPLRRD